MCQMLLSINPEFVESILNGTKLFEYRKFRCREDVDKIIIYATAPQKQVVAEAEIEYKDSKATSIFVKFPVVEGNGETTFWHLIFLF